MATVYKAPLDPPTFNYETDLPRGVPYMDSPLHKKEQAYTDGLAELARAQAKREGRPATLVGEIIRFPVADGYAQYMVWRQQPLQLIWIELGDAWSAHPALIRGLRLTDVRRQVEAAKRLAAWFAAKKGA